MTTSQQADPLIGRLVDGRYRVRARIARGGMATVYVATDLRLERRIALKVMHGHLSDDSVFQSRFIQEARSAARLADPHVVNVFDQGQDGELAYLVMEYLPGITLRELMREQRRLTIPQTITIMDAILSGLAAAHRAGIVHRDVKPENVLLAEDGRIKIGDFGLARATTANTATGQQLLGTIAYLAPELVTRGTADARSDIYALGIMLYEMLVGEQPYKGEQPMQIAFQHATESVPRPSVRNPGVPEQLDELVLWATEKAPEERPDDAQAMLERLRAIERELGITPTVTAQSARATTSIADSNELTLVLPSMPPAVTTPISAPLDNAALLRRRTRKRRTRGGLLMAFVLLLAMAAAGTGWWFGSGPGSLVAVPEVSSFSFADASAELTEAGFVPVEGTVNSLDVEVGLAVSTDPEPGSRHDRGTEVTVFISQGPAKHSLAPLNGLSEADAGSALEAANVTVADPVRMYSGAATDIVINAEVTPRAGGETYACGDGCDVFEGDSVVLLVSLGPVPDVSGMKVDQATQTLEDKQLKVNGETFTEYHEEIKSGRVIRIAEREDGANWRPGDTVTLVVSDGPEPIEVPDVSGMALPDAMQLLRDAGFSPETSVPEFAWGLFTASSTDPEDGEFLQRGSKVRVRASG